MDSGEERRRFQRLDLSEPIPGTFGSESVRIYDIGLVGAFFSHRARFELGMREKLAFHYGQETLEFECEIVRTGPNAEAEEHPFVSGASIVAAYDHSDQKLRQLIADHVVRVVSAQEANALGLRDQNRIDPDHTLTALGSARRALKTGYLSCRLRDGAWKRVPSLLPDQPPDGFTIAAYEDESQIERLCSAYEQADAEGRQFLRMLAELSISEAKGIPPRK